MIWKWKKVSKPTLSLLRKGGTDSRQNGGPSKLEREFAEKVHNPTLSHLLQVIQGLMLFLPSTRITADEALDFLETSEE